MDHPVNVTHSVLAVYKVEHSPMGNFESWFRTVGTYKLKSGVLTLFRDLTMPVLLWESKEILPQVIDGDKSIFHPRFAMPTCFDLESISSNIRIASEDEILEYNIFCHTV